jgi:hypothetical protein
MTLLGQSMFDRRKRCTVKMLSLVTYPRLSQWRFPIGYLLSSALLLSYVPPLGMKNQSVQFRMNRVATTTIAETYILGLRATLEDCVVVENVVNERGAFQKRRRLIA